MIYTTQCCCDITQMLLYWAPCRQWDIIIFFPSIIKCSVRYSIWETHHRTRVVIFIFLGQRLLWGHWSVSLWCLKNQPCKNPTFGSWVFPFHTGLHQNWDHCWLGDGASTGLHLKTEFGLKTHFLDCKNAEAVARKQPSKFGCQMLCFLEYKLFFM